MTFDALAARLINEQLTNYKMFIAYIYNHAKAYESVDIIYAQGEDIRAGTRDGLAKYFKLYIKDVPDLSQNVQDYIWHSSKTLTLNKEEDFGILESTKNGTIKCIISSDNKHYDHFEEYLKTQYIIDIFCKQEPPFDILGAFDYLAFNRELAGREDAIFDRDFLDGL